MTIEQKGVEAPIVTAPAQSEVDLAKDLEETRAALAKKSEEADNYKRGMLKAKGKLPADPVDEDTGETMEEKMRRIAREEQINSEKAQLQAKEKATVDAILKRNKELEVALKNRGQVMSPSGSGSNQEKPEVRTDDYLSADQISALKAKGWDDKKIEAFKKNAKNPQLSQPPK